MATERVKSPRILHLAPIDQWQKTRQDSSLDYRDPSLDEEGFIHCSTPEQVLIPANERFHGRTDLVLLVIDPAALAAPVVYEDCYESGHEFPHVYGPLPVEAVVEVIPFPCGPDGSFQLPEKLR